MSLNKVTLCFFIAIVSASFFACSSDNNSTCAEPEISSSSIDVIPDSDRGSSSSITENPSSSSSAVPVSSGDTAVASSVKLESSSSATTEDLATPSSSSATTPVSSSSADPNLLWSEEFDGTALNTEFWSYETGATGWGNNELQYYTDRTDNAYVADGLLHIVAKNELFERAPYTSARLVTKGKFSFTYGTVEARIALPAGKGIWPAFWMLGENIEEVNWPTCGEIDIIEAVNEEHVIYGTHHWAHEGEHAEYGNSTKEYYGTSKQLDITEFHDYKMVWDKNAITMYVDDFKYQEIDITLPKNADGTVDATSDMAAFHKPFFFILNVAVGGTWPGFDIDDAQFPTEMLVDYIRVYKN